MGIFFLICEETRKYFKNEAFNTFVGSANNGGDASVTCRPVHWGGVLAPEAMFFTEDASGDEHQVWAWDYNNGDIPYASCNGALWYKKDDLGSGVCTPSYDAETKSWSGCGHAHCYGDITCTGCQF